jgi:hypothetical protein
MDNPLSKLALDYWYKVVLVVCIAIFLLTGSGLLHAFPTVPTALISLGGFFVGLGEWVNHPLQTALMRGSAMFPSGVISGHPRAPKPLGLTFDILGAALIVYGGYKFLA